MTRYEMLDRIGVGGMAEIFRGRAVAGGGFEKPVAIKRILPHLSQDERFVKMLITEANTLSQLRHRNIVQIFDVGLGEDGQYFLVMEYVPGTDLRTLYDALEKRGKRLPVALSLHVGAEIADALEFAHRSTSSKGEPLRLVHRDVSPSNVLLSQSGEVKLTDFGIAKRMEEVTGHHGVRGKFAYISPEQAVNKSVDARSDVFSVGIVLFELATGRRLFSAMSDFDALQAVRAGSFPRPRSYDPMMPRELEDIIVKAMAPAPEDRYQAAGELGAALRELRYSVLTTAGDPAKELSQILAAIARRRDEDEAEEELTREPTVLRIHTAAGFTGIGMEERLVSDGGFDEEATRAMSGAQIQRIIEDARSTGNKFSHESTQDVSIEQLLEVAPLSEAETKMIDTRSMPTRDPSTPTGEAGAASSMSGFVVPERAATPTVREVFHAGEMLDTGRPQVDVETEYVARVDDEYFGMPKGRAIILASIMAAALAVAAFAIAGSMLSSNDARPDATHPDAGVSVDIPRGEIETGGGLMDDAPPLADEVDAGAKPKPRAKPAKKPANKPAQKPTKKPAKKTKK
jgi:serine/threonine protein kinase